MKSLFKVYSFLLALVIAQPMFSQEAETYPVNGVYTKNHTYYAFKNATIYVDGETIIEKGTLVIKDGRVEKVGALVTIPKGAVVFDLKGKFIYPSFIDMYSNYGMPEVEKAEWNPNPQMESNTDGAYAWNQSIKPEISAAEIFTINEKEAEELRNIGFGAVLSHQMDGIARGTSVFTTLASGSENLSIIKGNASAHYSFSKGSSRQSYPSSLMGSIALLRQTYYDALWYSEAEFAEFNLSLQSLNNAWQIPQIFEANDKLNILRADKICDEFGFQYIFVGGGNEYQRLSEIRSTGGALILPLNFPKAYDVEDPYDAMLVTLEQMKHWEMAPANPAMVADSNIVFAFTTNGLKKKKDFLENLRKAVEFGLSEEDAINALTLIPAELLDLDEDIGTLEKGMIANFIITSSNIFSEGSTIYENWIKGEQYIIKDMNLIDVRGTYNLNVNNTVYELKVKGSHDKPKGVIEQVLTDVDDMGEAVIDTIKTNVDIKLDGRLITVSFNSVEEPNTGMIRLSGDVHATGGVWSGNGQLGDGTWVMWTAIKNTEFEEEDNPEKEAVSDTLTLGNITYPNMAYGWDSLPRQLNYLFTNATVWTNTDTGIVENFDVAVKAGKIVGVGNNLIATDYFTNEDSVVVVDATGKHLTSGIIDEHSHIAISNGVNESGQASSAEVSIGHVVNSDDVNIYRQVAGGVTCSQLLHGSANPIGGQSAIIKLRWGQTPDSMLIAGADGFIKFALGENVKQSNWGDYNTVRFPQTRMGVEQVFYDHFIRAKEYEQAWEEYNNLSNRAKENTAAPRVNLELQALLEILNSERFVTCHSYVQSEINMLMHVADSMGFVLNTFTHILEGYKVADKMLEHGAGGSTFSDWWAYKYEVNDAIPYNGAIMNKVGVVVAYNSDDAEMARRLNQEAGKAVKYGGVSQEDAWKFVTLNPAKLLHLDHRMGRIAVGMDADIVIWSNNPLSIYAQCEQTYIDGALYFDLEHDLHLRETMELERARLIEKMMLAKNGGEDTQKPKKVERHLYHCDTIEYDYMSAE